MTANLLSLNSTKTECFLIGLKQQIAKLQDCSLNITHSDRNLGFIFHEHITFSDQISALSKSFYSHNRELSCIRPYLDFKTASTIATSIVHSKLDYHSSLYFNLPKSQLNRQLIQNSVPLWKPLSFLMLFLSLSLYTGEQEAQLSHRGCAMPGVVEYFD